LEVGVYVQPTSVICSSKDECVSKNPVLELGKIYEVTFKLDRSVSDADAGRAVVEVIKRLRRSYPSVSINYIKIEGDTVVAEIFDPPIATAAGIAASIIRLVLTLAIAIVGTIAIEQIKEISIKTVEFVQKLPETLPQLPPWIGPAILATSVAIAGGGVALLIRSIRKR
jgi:hypothetical protein